MAGEMRSDVLGLSETRQHTVPQVNAQLWWSFNDKDGMSLRFFDGADLVAERRFADIIEAERFFQKLLTLRVQYGRPVPKPVEGVAYYWLDGARWMVQVGSSVADELGTDELDRSEAAEDAADVAATAGA